MIYCISVLLVVLSPFSLLILLICVYCLLAKGFPILLMFLKNSQFQGCFYCPFNIYFIYFIFFFIYFYQLEGNYFTILQWVLSYIDMNQPWIYMCSPSRSPLPPPSPSDPSGSSQCTRPEHLPHAPTWAGDLFHFFLL